MRSGRFVAILAVAFSAAALLFNVLVEPPAGDMTADPGIAAATATAPPGPVVDPGGLLGQLVVDDSRPPGGYRRDLFGDPWVDVDRNGCDTRQDALRAQSLTPVPATGCSTDGGSWSHVYVPWSTTNPSDVDVDHVVALADAWRSGAAAWSFDRRVEFANDLDVLWVVEDNANKSKGPKGPEKVEDWLEVQSARCPYATRYAVVKAKYQLSVTTVARDALGRLLEEC